MGNIIITTNNEFYPKDEDINTLIKYIAGETEGKEKTRYLNGRGLPKSYKKASERIICMQQYYRKTEQRRLYHFVISFPEEVRDANFVKIVAENVAEIFYERHQVYYGVHEDKKHLHIHFAVNAVSYVDGRKWHQSQKEFEEMKKKIKKIAQEIEDIVR